MKCISLTQPWATLVAIGAKKIETRSWRTNYRGPIAIHAAKGFPTSCRMLFQRPPFFGALGNAGIKSAHDLPRGAIVAVANLVSCFQFARGYYVEFPEREFGDFTQGRWGFDLRDAVRLATPIQCRGSLGIIDLPEDISAALEAQIGARS